MTFMFLSSTVYPIFLVIHSRPEVAPMLAWGIVKAWTTSRDAPLNGHLVAVQLSPYCTMLTVQQIVYVLPVSIVVVPVCFPSWEYVLSHQSFQNCNNRFQPNRGLLCWFPMYKRAGLLSVKSFVPTPRWIPPRKRGPGPSSHSGGAVQRNSIR